MFIAIGFFYSIPSQPLSPSPRHIELHPFCRFRLRSESSLSHVIFYCLNSLVSLISRWVHCKVCDFSYLVNHCSIDWFRISNLCLWGLFFFFFFLNKKYNWPNRMVFQTLFVNEILKSRYWFNPPCIKNRLVSWSNNKKLSLEADAVDWNSKKKKKLSL